MVMAEGVRRTRSRFSLACISTRRVAHWCASAAICATSLRRQEMSR